MEESGGELQSIDIAQIQEAEKPRIKPNVLYLEDEPQISDVVKMMFGRLFKETPIVHANSVQGGLEAVRQAEKSGKPFNFILADFDIWGGNSGEVISEAQRGNKEIVALIASGRNPNSDPDFEALRAEGVKFTALQKAHNFTAEELKIQMDRAERILNGEPSELE